MSTTDEAADSIAAVIQDHVDVCNNLLVLAQKAAEALKSATAFPSATILAERRALLSRLESSLRWLREKQPLWHQLPTERRVRNDQMNQLLQTALDTIMRVLVLDRENEQNLLRRGLLPVRSLPAVERSRPHYVAQLYQHHAKA